MTDNGRHDAFLLLFCFARRILLQVFATFWIWFAIRVFSCPRFINWSLIVLIWASNWKFVGQSDQLVFYKVLLLVNYWCLCTLEHLKIQIFIFEYLKSNFIVLYFWFSSLINFNSSSSVSVPIMNRSSMNHKNVINFYFMHEYMNFDSKIAKKILA